MSNVPSVETLRAMRVADVMERWPQVVPLFQRFRLACCGCAMADFCSISEVVCYYEHVDEASFLDELQTAIAGHEVTAASRPETDQKSEQE